jgi:hypothetical protein
MSYELNLITRNSFHYRVLAALVGFKAIKQQPRLFFPVKSQALARKSDSSMV